MSSGRISDDRKTVTFDINLNRIVGLFTLTHMDKHPDIDHDKDRIMMRMEIRDAKDINAQMYTSRHVIIDKDYTKILSHFFRKVADVMEEWYE